MLKQDLGAATHVYSIIYCSALKEVSFSPSSSFFSLVMPDCRAGICSREKVEMTVATVGQTTMHALGNHQPTCMCDHPSSRSTVFRSFILELCKTSGQAMQYAAAVDGTIYGLDLQGIGVPGVNALIHFAEKSDLACSGTQRALSGG